MGETYADPLVDLQKGLPSKIDGWRAESEDRIFDSETIFSYINGAGEVYRAYNMKTCLSRRYTHTKGPVIVLDIFDMGSSKDAFGVFTHDRDGEILNVGQGALYRPGWMSFWKDRFFVSIYAEEETDASERSVKQLGGDVASLIPEKGAKPMILSKLPREGLSTEKVRYLHHPIILNYHFYVSDENILNLTPETDAALADYRRGDERARLLLVTYPDERKAEEAYSIFLKHYLPEAESKGTVLLEDGKWATAALKGRLLTIVLEADSQALAESLLKEASGEK